jgi:ribosome biogenesis GTPase
MVLRQLGWGIDFERHFQLQDIPGSVPGRVASENRHLYQVFTEKGVLKTRLSGRLRRQAGEGGLSPVAGDWVALTLSPGDEGGVIHTVLPRKSRFSRQASGGKTEQQVVAANVDTVFIVGALDEGRSINARRFERYLTLARSSGAVPVIVLNKADLCADIESFIGQVLPAVAGVPVHPVSALQGTGLDALKSYIAPGKTVAFLGPSGVGKSALINALLGEERQKTGEIRERDHTGKHTTTARELILVPGGGVVIDTPGMREIQMWAEEGDLLENFEDIETLGRRCRFKDCKHNNEPGCAVRYAIESGELDAGRLESFEKLQREVRHHEARQSGNERRLERERWKKISQWQKSREEANH